jgi:hypothetical protein
METQTEQKIKRVNLELSKVAFILRKDRKKITLKEFLSYKYNTIINGYLYLLDNGDYLFKEPSSLSISMTPDYTYWLIEVLKEK